MTEVGFYHLTRTPLARALPQLLGRTLAAGQRAVVRCPAEAVVAELDAALWEAAEPEWLPHGTAADGDADLQPIWLTATDEAPNGARFLFLVGGAESAAWTGFARVFDLFDGRDEAAVAAARDRWRAVRSAGAKPVYWKQTERGWARQD